MSAADAIAQEREYFPERFNEKKDKNKDNSYIVVDWNDRITYQYTLEEVRALILSLINNYKDTDNVYPQYLRVVLIDLTFEQMSSILREYNKTIEKIK